MTKDDKRLADFEMKLEAAMQTITAMQAHTQRVDVARVALSRNGVTDPGAADYIAAQIGQTDTGRWVAFTDNGTARVGDDADCTMGLDALVREYKAQTGSRVDNPPHGKGASSDAVNPFVKGPGFSITAQMVMMKTDPERAEHMQYLASVGRA